MLIILYLKFSRRDIQIPVFILFIEPTSILTSILEYKSKPADLFEAHVGIIASSFIKAISNIIILILHNYHFH